MADQLLRRSNQIQQIGNPYPPNMDQSAATRQVLEAASVPGFNLQQNTGTTRNVEGAARCRSYKGIEGLRRLQQDQANRSYYDGGCGWIYKPSGGLTPEISQGALGTAEGPTDPDDKLGAGSQWFWNLGRAEKQISTDLCKNVRACDQLRLLGNFADLCGWCKGSGRAIPVQNGRARYPNDPMLTCQAANIVTTAGGSCEADSLGLEGFQAIQKPAQFVGQGARGQMSFFRETFVDGGSLGSLATCKPPLSKQCVASAARMAGCSDSGSLITALRSAPDGKNYDIALRETLPFRTYQESANPSITRAVLEDGSASLTTALADFTTLMQNTQSQTPKLKFAARDLCLKAGSWDDYNFCGELQPTSTINEQTIGCLQEDWKRSGGSAKGTGYPTLESWKGRTYADYVAYRDSVKVDIQSQDKSTNAKGIQSLLGLDTEAAPVRGNLPRSETTRGAETVWIQLGDVGRPGTAVPVVLRCDVKLARDGEVLPKIFNIEEISPKYNVPKEHIACTSMFEIRPDQAQQVRFDVITDDGFMLGHNQNPFENSEYRTGDWGSWRYQGPTRYTSEPYAIAPESAQQPNVFVTKWWNGIGLAYLHLTQLLEDGKRLDQSESFEGRKDMYLVQEPLAPWTQFEICAKGGTVAFQEKRWFGMAALDGAGGQIPSFESVSASVVLQTDPMNRKTSPAKKAYASFVSNSWWHTKNYFAFTAFKTVTLAYRPMATLASGASVAIWNHANFAGFSVGATLRNNGGKYELAFWDGQTWQTKDIRINEWNLLVVQYIGSQRGVTKFTVHNFPFATLRDKSGLRAAVNEMIGPQGGVGQQVLVGGPMQNLSNSGFLTVGGSCPDYRDANGQVTWTLQSFTGDIAWMHGFRNYIDTSELLQAEVEQLWMSRWPLKEGI